MTERTPLVPLPPMRVEIARRLLSPPWVPTMLAQAIGRACRSRPFAVPVRVGVPLAALGPRFARALHALTGPMGPLLLATGERPELRALPSGATVVVEPARLDAAGSVHLAALLDDGEAWVVALTGPDDVLDPALEERLGAVVVDVPPLARRTLELPAISAAVLHVVAERAGRAAPVLAPAARTALAARAWPGVVLELERVLAHALASTDTATLELQHLGLDADEPEPAAAAVEPATTAAPEPSAARLELLLAELAHELLNPLVTVKTFAGHLPQLVDDAELRTQFAERADEAIARMQQLLDNVLEFARLGTPARAPVEVGPVLERLLAEVTPELAARAVRVRRAGASSVQCAGDPAQLEYALRNLLAGVVREVPARDELLIDTTQNGVVNVCFAAGDAAAARLRRLVSPDGAARLDDPAVLPLAFTLARAVLERNGGSLAVREDAGGSTTLVVRLPTTLAAVG